jgi:hypothetical protein
MATRSESTQIGTGFVSVRLWAVPKEAKSVEHRRSDRRSAAAFPAKLQKIEIRS